MSLTWFYLAMVMAIVVIGAVVALRLDATNQREKREQEQRNNQES